MHASQNLSLPMFSHFSPSLSKNNKYLSLYIPPLLSCSLPVLSLSLYIFSVVMLIFIFGFPLFSSLIESFYLLCFYFFLVCLCLSFYLYLSPPVSLSLSLFSLSLSPSLAFFLSLYLSFVSFSSCLLCQSLYLTSCLCVSWYPIDTVFCLYFLVFSRLSSLSLSLSLPSISHIFVILYLSLSLSESSTLFPADDLSNKPEALNIFNVERVLSWKKDAFKDIIVL